MAKSSPQQGFRVGLMFTSALFSIACNTQAWAYDLGGPRCGGEYGGLNLQFKKNITKFADVKKKLSSLRGASKPFTDMRLHGEHKRTTLYSEIEAALARGKDAGSERYDISVPVGSEEYIADALTSARIISRATHANGACGGAEVSYVFISKSKNVGDLSQATIFSEFVRDKIREYVVSGKDPGSLEDGRLVTSPIQPHFAIKQFTISVPSEVSRGSSASGAWDRFDLFLALFASRKNDFVIVIHTERLKVAPKTAFRPAPPTPEHFREISLGDSSANYQAEYIAAASVARFIGGPPDSCKVETEGFSAADEGPFRCTSKVAF